jgi:hypothetical protein
MELECERSLATYSKYITNVRVVKRNIKGKYFYISLYLQVETYIYGLTHEYSTRNRSDEQAVNMGLGL